MYSVIRFFSFALIAGVILPTERIQAQVKQSTLPNVCGGFERDLAQLDLKHYRELFFAEEAAERRARWEIEAVATDDVVTVVDRPRDCSRIIHTAIAILNDRIFEVERPSERIRKNSIAYDILRYGPYYLVRITTPDTEEVAFSGYDTIIILLVDDLSFVATFLG